MPAMTQSQSDHVPASSHPTPAVEAVPARLALTDGSVFHGQAFGYTSPATVDGEVCFNTSMTGYQEILTDPSYTGQIVAMTYPLIGNYGINDADVESSRITVRGFIVRELANRVSNYRSTRTLSDWLASQKILAITGIDTRALTRRLRIDGAMNGVLSTESMSDADLVSKARAARGLVGVDLVEGVTIDKPYQWSEDLGDWEPMQGIVPVDSNRPHVVAIDCGAKFNILRHLTHAGCRVTVVPYHTPAADILAMKPDGIFVSNGPGDPAAVAPAIATLKELITGTIPTFGICLGHQLLSLACGASTFKLKFGHRGGNQPVQNIHTRKVEITSQNHGFAVDTASLEQVGGEPTHINLNDGTLAGFRLKNRPVFAIQYHPEASPGPHDARYLFDCFMQMMRTGTSPTGQDMDQAQRARNTIEPTDATPAFV